MFNFTYLGNSDAESQSDVDSLSDGSSLNSLSDGATSNGCIIISDSDDFEFPRNQTASDNTLRIRKEQHLQASTLDSVDRLLMESDPDKTLTNSSQVDRLHHQQILQLQALPIQNPLAFQGRKVVHSFNVFFSFLCQT